MSQLPDSLRAHLLEPVHPGEPVRVDRRGEARNEVCRDHVILYLQLDGARIEAAGFRATGCPAALSYASAATELLVGRELRAELSAEVLDELSEAHGDPGTTRRHALVLIERALTECLRVAYSRTSC